jgi:hypothetical protein
MILFLLSAATIATACTSQREDAGRVADSPHLQAAATAPAPRQLTAEEKKLYQDMAAASWKYLDTYYNNTTGLVNATPDWANTTIWDVGGQLMGFRAAKELGLISQADFDKRVGKTLSTLEKEPLFRSVAYSKVYSTTGLGYGEGGSHGYAATDLGRFLVALKVLSANEPALRDQIARVVKRIDFSQVVKDGYLYGQLIGSSGKPWTFQEGRIGYEQYVARGFSEWGADVANAMDVNKNARPKTVMGVTILEDTRYTDRLLSEPFILYGIELGLSGPYRDLAANVLKLQQARYDSTGKMTIVSEDASRQPPTYFYYYCVYCSGKPFVIDQSTPGKLLDGPRWVSTKAAFGWHALMPNDYTKKAIDFVAPANDPQKGWATGVTESDRQSTKAWDVNTASVLLEIAAYQLRGGRPLIDP